jgi:hypothetical protein
LDWRMKGWVDSFGYYVHFHVKSFLTYPLSPKQCLWIFPTTLKRYMISKGSKEREKAWEKENLWSVDGNRKKNSKRIFHITTEYFFFVEICKKLLPNVIR